MKKQIFVAIVLLICAYSLSAQQKFTTEFFKLSERNYAYAIYQRQIDSTLQFIDHRDEKQNYELRAFPDTLLAYGFSWVEKKEELPLILSMGDTVSMTIELAKPFGILTPHFCPQKVVQEYYEAIPETTVFTLTGNDKLNPKNWRLDYVSPQYRKRRRVIVHIPCGPQTISFPGRDTTVIAFFPNDKLSEKEQQIINSICTDELVHLRYEPMKSTEFSYQKVAANYEYEVRRQAEYSVVNTYTKKEVTQHLIDLKTKLKAKGYYEGALNMSIDREFKLALMNYQIDKGFPIGQFDVGTIAAILSE